MTTDSVFLIEEFAALTPGEPFRLFPFGRISKNGRVKEITRELAAKFKLPHFKPAIKLGSHKDETRAGGFIIALEVREDGVYAVPEWTEEGAAALARGDYRYHSPEIIWDGFIEDSSTGAQIAGPVIIGDALLHTPALGEAAALYTFDRGAKTMSENTDMVTMPASVWERFVATLGFRNNDQPEPEPVTETQPAVDVDAFAAIQAERDDLAARIERMAAEQAHAKRVQSFAAELRETPLADNAEIHGILAGLADEHADAITQQFKALAAQAAAAGLSNPVGAADNPTANDPAGAFDAEVKRVMAESKINYTAAVQRVAASNPELLEGVL